MATRRAVLRGGAAFAAVATAGKPVVAAPHPDAELLAVCTRLAAMQAEWQRLYDATSDLPALTTAADHAWQRYSDDVWPAGDLPARLLDLPAQTPQGLAAKAAAILAVDDAAAYCDVRDDSCSLSRALLRDAAGSAYRPLGEGC